MVQMDELMDGFRQGGYQVEPVYEQGIYACYTMVNGSVYLVNLVDDNLEYGLTQEKYSVILEQMKHDFASRGYLNLNILTIILSDHIGQANTLIEPYAQHWIIDRRTGRLIIYENQPGYFLDAKEIIESLSDHNIYQDINYSDNTYLEKRHVLPIFNSIIIIINVIAFIYTDLHGNTENAEYLLSCGAMYGQNVVVLHQYYRLITHMFLHFGIAHLANNMFVLAIIGSYLERIVGKVRFIVIYFVSGIVAGLVSMVYNIIQHINAVSAGASGAIFGVVGAMLYVVVANRGKVENLTTRKLAVFILLTLVTGFTSSGVDNMAHLGGFAAGFLIALIIYKPKNVEQTG
jgi:Uncharacterized membrane protein (homolog of Drosophila rhomboid)